MTSPRRTKKSGQCLTQLVDWDSPSTETGTVKRRASCPENTSKGSINTHDTIIESETPSDSGSSSLNGERADSLIEIEERISCIINENRSSQSNSESDVEVIINSIFEEPIREESIDSANCTTKFDRSKTFIKSKNDRSSLTVCQETVKKVKVLKAPTSIRKLGISLDKVKNSISAKDSIKTENTANVFPVYKSKIPNSNVNDDKSKKKVNSKLKLPFSPSKVMDKPKINYLHDRTQDKDVKPQSLLATPVRRTISNEYVRLKFTNDTVVRRTIDGKSIPKITPKIQSIIPESPVDSEDPFLNLSPNKKYTVTVNNKVRCDKDNYVIFDPTTGFSAHAKQSRIPSAKLNNVDKTKIPVKSPITETATSNVNRTASASDTDSGILSPNSETDAKNSTYHYVNAAVFSETAKKQPSDLDIRIVDPAVAKKATEQIKSSVANSRITHDVK
ncbi:unnamed protein product [Leptosia nina]|uniref:Uncharacterized protein n=1 Tax=Leptosia nina TaxID=320188 RepID=A0AAV1JID3_9NEOP